jgi:hypothetical protein
MDHGRKNELEGRNLARYYAQYVYGYVSSRRFVFAAQPRISIHPSHAAADADDFQTYAVL